MKELQEFRKNKGLTQEEFGKILGVKKNFLSKVENGREKLSKDKLRILAELGFVEDKEESRLIEETLVKIDEIQRLNVEYWYTMKKLISKIGEMTKI